MEHALAQLVAALAAFDSVGWIGVGVAVCYALTWVTKHPQLDPWFRAARWRRPVSAIVFGAAYGGMLALSERRPWSAVGAAALGGALTAGLGAIGFDQAITGARPPSTPVEQPVDPPA